MTQKIELSNHAKRRNQELFPMFDARNDAKEMVNCNSDEIYRLKSTPSYRRLKESDKKNVKYKKLPDETIYFVVTEKVLRSGKHISLIVTLIDLKNESSSFVDESFKKEMIKAAFELKESSKKVKQKSKKKKVRPNYEKVYNESLLLSSQKRVLQSLMVFNDANVLKKKLSLDEIDCNRYEYSTAMLKKLMRLNARMMGIKETQELLLNPELNENKRQEILSNLKSRCLNILSEFSRREYDFDFINYKTGQKRSRVKKLILDFLAESLSLITNVLFDKENMLFNKLKHKSQQEIISGMEFYEQFKGLNRNMDTELARFAANSLQVENKYVKELCEMTEGDVYSVELRFVSRMLNKKKQFLKRDEDKQSRIKKMIVFLDLLIEKIESKGLIKMPVEQLFKMEMA